MKYLFSPQNNLLIPETALELYASNPPSDLIEVSHAIFKEFTGPCEQGKLRSSNSEGLPCWVDDPNVTAKSRYESALKSIDAIADKVRSYSGNISQLLDIEYQQVIAAHGRWYAEGYDEAKCPEEITAWAHAEGISALQAALDIAEAAAHREEVIRQIRTIRLEGKAAIRSADDKADFSAIAQSFIEQLEGVSNQ